MNDIYSKPSNDSKRTQKRWRPAPMHTPAAFEGGEKKGKRIR